jgi:hypothetical protein
MAAQPVIGRRRQHPGGNARNVRDMGGADRTSCWGRAEGLTRVAVVGVVVVSSGWDPRTSNLSLSCSNAIDARTGCLSVRFL